ncbi:MAG: SRPBCC family protein [Firmicutes bacterium]|nr:SRPBCC family protein [Bacillota bacterium]
MRYICEVTIDKSRDEVLELFDNPDNMYKWQKNLMKFEIIEGEPHKDGVKSRLTYDEKGRAFVMVETIEKFNYPDEMIAIYESGNMWNRCINTLIDQGNQTVWRLDSEFQGKGFMKLLCMVGKRMFVKQTMKDMNNFKAFAESV